MTCETQTGFFYIRKQLYIYTYLQFRRLLNFQSLCECIVYRLYIHIRKEYNYVFIGNITISIIYMIIKLNILKYRTSYNCQFKITIGVPLVSRLALGICN